MNKIRFENEKVHNLMLVFSMKIKKIASHDGSYADGDIL
jgi:hypothetical protein